MASSEDTLNQITGLQNQYKNLGVTTPDDIYKQMAQKVQGFQPQYQELANANTQAYAYPAQAMNEYQTNFGPQMNAGPDAFARLNSMLQGVGQRQGTANALSSTIDTMKGRLGDIANGVYGNAQAIGNNLQSQIGNLQPIYQSQLQNEQAQKQLELQRQQMYAQQQANQAATLPVYQGAAGGAFQSQPNGDTGQSLAHALQQNIGIYKGAGMAPAQIIQTPIIQGIAQKMSQAGYNNQQVQQFISQYL